MFITKVVTLVLGKHDRAIASYMLKSVFYFFFG